MKNIVLYLMLLIAVPATAQSGLFGSHSHHASTGKHHHGSLMHPHGHAEHPDISQGMATEDFEVALRILSKKTFDNSRLDAAKQIVQDNWMTTRQIASICGLFTYDSNRLEFAKFAYHFCVDRQNYFMLDEVFTYSSSKEELATYVRNNKL